MREIYSNCLNWTPRNMNADENTKKRREKHFETNWKISSIVFRRNGKKANFNCFETSWKSIVCLMTELFSQFKLRLFTVSDYLKSTRLIIFKTLAAFFLSLLHQKQWNYGKMATVRNELKRQRNAKNTSKSVNEKNRNQMKFLMSWADK